MNSMNDFDRAKKKILAVIRRHGVAKAGIFGSLARGQAKKSSDIDLLVEFKSSKSLLDLAGLKLSLESALNRKVDVLTYNSLHPLLRKSILSEQRKIL